MTTARQRTATVEVTRGGLNNDYIWLGARLASSAFFPADATGGNARSDGEGAMLTVHFEGLRPVQTDIAGGNKHFLRDRTAQAKFLRRQRLRPGDRIVIERLGTHEYRFRLPLKEQNLPARPTT